MYILVTVQVVIVYVAFDFVSGNNFLIWIFFCFDALFNSSENDFVALENLLHEKNREVKLNKALAIVI